MEIPHITGDLPQGCTSTGVKKCSSAVWTSRGSACGCCLLFHCLPLPIKVTVIQVGRDHWRLAGPTPTQGLNLDPAAKLDHVAQGPDVVWFATFALLAYIQWWIHHNQRDLFRKVCCSAKVMHGVVLCQTRDLALLLVVVIVQLKSALPNMPFFAPKPTG